MRWACRCCTPCPVARTHGWTVPIRRDSGNGRLVGLCVLAVLVLLQGVHALLSRRRSVRLCCLVALAIACLAWYCWN